KGTFASRLEELRPVLRRSASSILRRAEDVEDAVQEAMLRLLKKEAEFDPAKGSLLALGKITVRRVAIDLLEKKQPKLGGGDVELTGPAPALPLEAAQIQGRVREALESLPEVQRAAFLLVFQEGLKPTEAARELGLAPEAFRARLYRARCELRTLLE